MARPMCDLAQYKRMLESFLASNRQFQIIRNVACGRSSSASHERPRTLFILDSSFNPPTVAHFSMAESVITPLASEFPLPHRLLFLFSVHNADKSPSLETFEHRIALMVLMAEDMQAKWNSENNYNEFEREVGDSAGTVCFLPRLTPSIDIALTTQPFYNKKSSAISDNGAYSTDCTHVHIVGYDTALRIFDPKYYKSFSPPLSALNDFFTKHFFLVALRPDEGQEQDEIEQSQIWRDLKDGKLEADGAKSAWAERVIVMPGKKELLGVSSTKIRGAIERNDIETVEKFCPPGVFDWIKSNNLYRRDA